MRPCRPDAQPLLVTMLGRDAAAEALLQHMGRSGLGTQGVLRADDMRTPTVSVIFDKGAASRCSS